MQKYPGQIGILQGTKLQILLQDSMADFAQNSKQFVVDSKLLNITT